MQSGLVGSPDELRVRTGTPLGIVEETLVAVMGRYAPLDTSVTIALPS
jgi:hypothetical protein